MDLTDNVKNQVEASSKNVDDENTEEVTHKLFVGNVPFKCTDEEFSECFKDVEGFKSADIIRHLFSDVTRGFGFVVFDTEENKNKYLESNPNVEVRGRQLRITPYKKSETGSDVQEPPAKTEKKGGFVLQLSNIPININIIEFNKILNSMGNVKKYKLNKNQLGKLTGSAIIEVGDKVTYESLLQNTEMKIDDEEIDIQPAQRRNRFSYFNQPPGWNGGRTNNFGNPFFNNHRPFNNMRNNFR